MCAIWCSPGLFCGLAQPEIGARGLHRRQISFGVGWREAHLEVFVALGGIGGQRLQYGLAAGEVAQFMQRYRQIVTNPGFFQPMQRLAAIVQHGFQRGAGFGIGFFVIQGLEFLAGLFLRLRGAHSGRLEINPGETGAHAAEHAAGFHGLAVHFNIPAFQRKRDKTGFFAIAGIKLGLAIANLAVQRTGMGIAANCADVEGLRVASGRFDGQRPPAFFGDINARFETLCLRGQRNSEDERCCKTGKRAHDFYGQKFVNT